jgi:2-succinyl-5-enolpyruvyl-6-hydroxy-3-cyclohexene-1-carboxylate synthase
MERNLLKNPGNSGDFGIMNLELSTSLNNQLAEHVIATMLENGIQECCLAAGSRNAPLAYALNQSSQIKTYYWSEERSAAFFALGRIKATKRPVAIVTTSGTAAAEVLPAAMSAHYLGLPLLMITADRPRHFRGSGAPQAAEQLGLFSHYAHFEQDVAAGEICHLAKWTCEGPAHLNVCLDEPKDAECQLIQCPPFILESRQMPVKPVLKEHLDAFACFIQKVRFPLVVVGAVDVAYKEALIAFLLKLGAPVYAEGLSHIREEGRLEHLRINRIDRIWQIAEQNGYPIDGILRLGEIPTARLWRDLENGKIDVCSISELPFSGLSGFGIIHTSLPQFFDQASQYLPSTNYSFQRWLAKDHSYCHSLHQLFQEEPLAEPSLIHALSTKLPLNAHIYLGNSLPVREWDLAAVRDNKNYGMQASRGVNGIDGQIATFLGLSIAEKSNWAILGDLTILYDMAAPWVLQQLDPDVHINLIVINNAGGQIFSRMYQNPCFINAHELQFESFAAFWKMHYEKWMQIPANILPNKSHRLIEIMPDAQATNRFWEKLGQL